MLSPQSLDGFIKQFSRYAEGSFQIFFSKDNPLIKSGLKIRQRIAYFETFYSYFSPLWILIFLISPAIFYFTLTPPIKAFNFDFFLRFLAFNILNIIVTTIGSWGFSTKRSEQYYIGAFWYKIKAFFKILSGVNLKFNPTNKGISNEKWSKNIKHVIPHIFIAVLTLVGFMYNLILIIKNQHPSYSAFFANSIWAFYNIYQMNPIIRAAFKTQHPYPTNHHATTLWDLSSSLFATTSAFEIGIIDSTELDTRLRTTFNSLLTIPLYDHKLPNKVYNTVDLEMTTYDNRPTPKGVGWSSMDIGRFLSFCKTVIHKYPRYTDYIKNILLKWDLQGAIENASLVGIGLSFKDGREMKVQEGKLGYEEYCAKGFQQMGYDVSNAMLYTDFIKFIEVYNEEIATDSREVKYHPGYNYVVSDPYILDGIEHGFDINSCELGYRIFLVQKKRYQQTKKLTAVGETHIDTIPYFVYNSVYVDGETWHCVSEGGEDASNFKTFSTAVAFGYYYLYEDPYSELLFNKVKTLYHKDLGFYSGVYEKSEKINKAITANVNGIILEALNYKLHGPITNNWLK